MAHSAMRQFDITKWLNAWRSGEKDAESILFSEVQAQLRDMCRRRLAQVISTKLTLHPTELFQELYLRLEDQTKEIDWENRKHFFFIAGRIIRQIIADEIRRKRAGKRDGVLHPYTDSLLVSHTPVPLDILDSALQALEQRSPELAQIVDLRFFVGLGFTEITQTLRITESQAKYRWKKAKLWLHFYLQK